ncbi:ABC transporter ATP-binding protein [Desulfonatronovibrio magnus]|uniref:ABC transporter ATP-binding protein n=1 Tax=Desulfonatronovibrio magnus TaxID=698827 RepID=UPI001E4C4FAE|nr:oligopeptide/dipeptide ABC transporter ATP-binding protein [Desulfonatronovibrio magnus]
MNKLTVKSLIKQYGGGRTLLGRKLSAVHAVRGIDFKVDKGEILGIVGESGCGKSTLAKMLVGLEAPTKGSIELDGKVFARTGTVPDRKALARRIQYIFQDPLSSLNPRKTVEQILEAPLKYLLGMNSDQRKKRMEELMRSVNLRPEFLTRYPHEFSGGQAQRIGIARALAPNPELLILDEPVSALDVSVQAQVLNLLKDLRAEFNLTYLFISHDLGVVRNLCDRVAVMYFGKFVEYGPTDEIFEKCRHPYTRLLLGSVPGIGTDSLKGEEETAELPDPYHPPKGCSFAPRCSRADDQCQKVDPLLEEISSEHLAACFFPYE